MSFSGKKPTYFPPANGSVMLALKEKSADCDSIENRQILIGHSCFAFLLEELLTDF
jgi:hypothetical protein